MRYRVGLCAILCASICMQWPIPAQADQAAQVHYDGFKSFTILVAPCKGVRTLVQSEIQEILLAEWGIVGFKESRIPLRIALFHWQKNNESSPDIRNPRSGIQNLGFPYMGPASLQSRFFQRKRDWRDLEAAIMKLSNWKLTRLHTCSLVLRNSKMAAEVFGTI